MRLKRTRKSISIPLFSMSDVAFLLLIFIMLVSLLNYRIEVQIEYAQAQTARRVSAERNLEIWVDRFGGLYLNGIPGDIRFIEHGIVEAYRNAPETRVHVIADRNTPFENVHAVLDILQLLEHREVSFVVKNE